jgi:wyosine [tRNA(Phe)-imidazoG37] synthetase (radical SAM superfamily)
MFDKAGALTPPMFDDTTAMEEKNNGEMQRVMFHSTIFGPIHSRRLGTSLGVNLMPVDGKVCSFDCLYCEAGFNAQGPGNTPIPSRSEVKRLLEEKLQQMSAVGQGLDVITFSGNGEPTLHPEFPGVVADTISLRNRYYPQAHVSVLTNSTRIDKPEVAAALMTVDNNILKLDSAIDHTIRVVDRPNQPGFSAETIINRLKQFSGQGIIQTMMLRGEYNGQPFDNTTPDEVNALIEAYRAIAPREIMLYSLDRPTPAHNLHKIPAETLQAIGNKIHTATGIPVQVSV